MTSCGCRRTVKSASAGLEMLCSWSSAPSASLAAADAAAGCAAAGITPRLAVVVATREHSAAWYVRTLSGAARRLGMIKVGVVAVRLEGIGK